MDYRNNIPGETVYDKAFTEQETTETTEFQTTGSQNTGQTPGATQKNYAGNACNYAVISLTLGISSFLIIFLIPIFGLALSAIGGVFGIVLGVKGRKQSPGLAWIGIVLSIISLVLVLLGLVLLCLLGWAIIVTLVSGLPQEYPFFSNWFNGGNNGIMPYGGFNGFYFD